MYQKKEQADTTMMTSLWPMGELDLLTWGRRACLTLYGSSISFNSFEVNTHTHMYPLISSFENRLPYSTPCIHCFSTLYSEIISITSGPPPEARVKVLLEKKSWVSKAGFLSLSLFKILRSSEPSGAVQTNVSGIKRQKSRVGLERCWLKRGRNGSPSVVENSRKLSKESMEQDKKRLGIFHYKKKRRNRIE